MKAIKSGTPINRQLTTNNQRQKFIATIEFFPEKGKYHYDGHRACNIFLSPKETKKYNNICPKCGKKLTIGVMNRVNELADRRIKISSKENFNKFNNFTPYYNLIPLGEIIAEAFNVGVNTKQVKKEYENLIKTFGNELKILLEINSNELKSAANPRIAEAIKKIREGKIKIRPGYDGEYGKISIFNDKPLIYRSRR